MTNPQSPTAALVSALQRIAKWHDEFQETGQAWPDGKPMSYGAAYGSNGQRDFMRKVAQDALDEFAAVPNPTGWRDIATAPLNGTVVLLFARHVDAEASTRVVGHYLEQYGWIAASYVVQPIAKLVPSHWMPLPRFPGAHPAEQQEGDAAGEKDAAMLDWMAESGAYVAWAPDRDSCHIMLLQDDGNYYLAEGWGCGNYDTAREAIRAAMQAMKGERNGR